jgi:hypothetical protein
MKPIHEMLREKQLELARLQKEVEALRLVAGMVSEESKVESAPQELAALPLAQEVPPPRPMPAAVAPPAPLSVPAPLSPPPMMLRPPAPAYGEVALASANDALAKRFP